MQYYRSADKSIARPTSRCILFDGENVTFDASLVIQGVRGGNVPDFRRMFLKLKYTNITQNHLYLKLNGYGDNGERSLKV